MIWQNATDVFITLNKLNVCCKVSTICKIKFVTYIYLFDFQLRIAQ